MKTVRIGLIGDFNAAVIAHQAIPGALALAGESQGVSCEPAWLPKPSLENANQDQLRHFQGLWCVPASPYASTSGALSAIRFAREGRIPFLGTCGGFQHALMEFAANVLHLPADHAELAPNAAAPLISLLACSLVEKTGAITFVKDSRLRSIYGVASAEEGYHCRFGLNPKHEAQLQAGGLRISARDSAGEVRAVELADHPFFLATLFQPERSALTGRAHPLITAFVRAAAGT